MKSTVHVTGFLFFEDTKTEVKVGWYPRYTHTARRCVRVFEPLELDAINKIREAAKGKMHLDRKPTINDVMHSLFAGTVAEYLRERGDWAFLDALEKKKRGGKGPLIRIWTPYMFLHPDFASDPFNDLHNYWSMSSTPLPVAAPTALARLAESQKINRELLISGHDARATANTQKLVSQSLGWEIQGIFNLRATTAQ